jgi:hypothetical protein
MRGLSVTGALLAALAVSACAGAPTAPAPPSPQVTFPAPPAPQAVLLLGDATEGEPVVISDWPVVFDGSRSTGAGPLGYHLEIGEGSVVTEPTVTRALSRYSLRTDRLVATLTVTDALGRTASTSQPYRVALVDNGSGTFWIEPGRNPGESLRRRFVLRQSGTALTGFYTDYTASRSGHSVGIIGTLTSQRTFTVTTADGNEAFEGSMEYNGDPQVWPRGFFLRLVAMRGPLTGSTLVLSLADPY